MASAYMEARKKKIQQRKQTLNLVEEDEELQVTTTGHRRSGRPLVSPGSIRQVATALTPRSNRYQLMMSVPSETSIEDDLFSVSSAKTTQTSTSQASGFARSAYSRYKKGNKAANKRSNGGVVGFGEEDGGDELSGIIRSRQQHNHHVENQKTITKDGVMLPSGLLLPPAGYQDSIDYTNFGASEKEDNNMENVNPNGVVVVGADPDTTQNNNKKNDDVYVGKDNKMFIFSSFNEEKAQIDKQLLMHKQLQMEQRHQRRQQEHDTSFIAKKEPAVLETKNNITCHANASCTPPIAPPLVVDNHNRGEVDDNDELTPPAGLMQARAKPFEYGRSFQSLFTIDYADTAKKSLSCGGNTADHSSEGNNTNKINNTSHHIRSHSLNSSSNKGDHVQRIASLADDCTTMASGSGKSEDDDEEQQQQQQPVRPPGDNNKEEAINMDSRTRSTTSDDTPPYQLEASLSNSQRPVPTLSSLTLPNFNVVSQVPTSQGEELEYQNDDNEEQQAKPRANKENASDEDLESNVDDDDGFDDEEKQSETSKRVENSNHDLFLVSRRMNLESKDTEQQQQQRFSVGSCTFSKRCIAVFLLVCIVLGAIVAGAIVASTKESSSGNDDAGVQDDSKEGPADTNESPSDTLPTTGVGQVKVSSTTSSSAGLPTTSSSPSDMPSVQPTLAPTTAPTTPFPTFSPETASFLPDFTMETILSDIYNNDVNSTSPQAKALAWVKEHPLFVVVNDGTNETTEMETWRKQQLLALATLFEATGGDISWNNEWSEKWLNASIDECEWQQLGGSISSSVGRSSSASITTSSTTCSIPDGRYQELDLVLFGLQGTIPPEVSLLTNLHQLALQHNHLEGSLPTQLGELTELTSLALLSNQLTGDLPSQLGQLSSVDFLGLYENNFTGGLPSELGQMTQVTYFDCHDCGLSNTIPLQLGTMTSMTSLSLASNQLTGPIPTSLAQMTNLWELNLFDNQLSSTIPEGLNQLTALAHLGLNGNNLTGPIPSSISAMSNLGRLLLHNNSLTGTVPRSICGLARLTTLRVDCDLVTCGCPQCSCN